MAHFAEKSTFLTKKSCFFGNFRKIDSKQQKSLVYL